MKKIILLIILLIIPINSKALEYKIKKENYNILISDKYIKTNDILVIDDRKNNKNIQIVNSYKINNKKIQYEIIDEILEYNKKYPNNSWIRTRNSLYMEWNIHNILYNLHLFRSHTISVDFDQKVEFFYKLLYIYLQK